MEHDDRHDLQRLVRAARLDVAEAAAAVREASSGAGTPELRRAGRSLAELERLLAHDAPDNPYTDPVRRAGESGDAVHRRVLLRLLSASAGAHDPERTALHALLGRPDVVDDRVLTAYRRLTLAYGQEFATVPPPRLLDAVRAHVDRTAAGLDLPLPSPLRARLGGVVAETAGLAGWILHTGGRRGEAHAFFNLARDAARDVGDVRLHALSLGSMACLFSSISRGALGGSRVAQRLLQQAVALVPAAGPDPGRAWLHGRLAEEEALLGHQAAFSRALEASRTALAGTTGDHHGVYGEHGVLTFWGAGGMGPAVVEGFGLGALGDPRAEDLLVPALAREPGASGRANLLGDLATARIARGEDDEAVALLAELIDVAVDGGVLGRVERARGLRRRLRHDVPGIRTLDDRLREAHA